MNEEALQDAYRLFSNGGYSGSVEEFKVLIDSNPEALNDSYKLFRGGGYSGDFEAYKTLIGQKKKKKLPKNFQTQLRKILYWIHNFLSQKVK